MMGIQWADQNNPGNPYGDAPQDPQQQQMRMMLAQQLIGQGQQFNPHGAYSPLNALSGLAGAAVGASLMKSMPMFGGGG